MNKIAKYYKKTDDEKIKCLLCPHECILNEDKFGICKTRKNISGDLYTLAYSNQCAINIDPIEKKPLLHFLPDTTAFSIATAGCNLSCKNCQNDSISQASPLDVPTYKLSPEDVVKKAIENNCKSIAYTYTDPIAFYEYTLDTAKIARKNGIKNVFISAGFINQEPLLELVPYLDAANIDLKSFDNNLYKKLNKAELQPVLDTLKTLHQNNVWLEITNLIVSTWTDDMNMIENMCKWLYENNLHNYPLHFNRFSPLYKLSSLQATKISTLEKARDIAMKSGIKYALIGNVWGHEAENTFCPNCKKVVINRTGFSSNKIFLKDGSCKFCGEPIAGVWG